MQINSGLAHLNLFESNSTNQIILIIGITLIATISVVSGVNKGIRRLSEVNLFLALILLVFVFFTGPTTFILKAFSENIGNYMQSLTETSFQTNIFYDNQFSTTVFYFAWWIAWSPFVGMFIARISRGRTIREFVSCVLLVPVLLTFIWMSVFGNTAIHMELMGDGGMVEAVQTNISTALFVMLQKMPLPEVSCTLAILVVMFFFVTSSDSASLVIDIITSGGQKNPPVWQKVFWAFSEGFVAIILLLTGGLIALQTGVIVTALPFAVVLLFVSYSLWKALKTDTGINLAQELGEDKNILLSRDFISVAGIQPVNTPISEKINIDSKNVLSNAPMLDHISEITSDDEFSKNWKKRLTRLKRKHYAKYFAEQYENISDEDIELANNNLKEFILDVVKPAFLDIKEELEKYNRIIQINFSEHQASIIVRKNNMEELFYGIRGKVFHRLGYNFPNFNLTDATVKCYAQVLLRSGGKKVYELKKFTRENIIHDFLNEYEKWAILD